MFMMFLAQLQIKDITTKIARRGHTASAAVAEQSQLVRLQA
jgi:hypothetical protein